MTVRGKLLLPLLAAALLGGCGGGSSSGGSSAADPGPMAGTLIQTPPQLLSTLDATELLLQLTGASNQQMQQLLGLIGSPVCDIAVYHIEYATAGGAGEATTASGALMVPTGTHSGCTGPRPIVLYAHATATDRGFDIADLTNEQNAEGLFLAAVFASQGYIVVAPNYAGYDTSTLPYQTFLVADQQSGEMIDALTAARSALPTAAAATTSDAGQLFITGYSQGGFVALATHRAMQARGMSVTASAPMSGPYALAAFVDAVFAGEVDGGAPVLATLLFSAYQNSYGNAYTDPAVVFAPQYAPGIDALFPTTSTRAALYSQGKLPEYALFSPSPPSPAYAAITPATTPADLAPVFALGFGTGNLINNSYRLSYLTDAQANPDGGFPTVTTGAPAASPGLMMRTLLAQNDLRDWLPAAPVLLCGGDLDPEVFWFNAELEQGYWTAQSAAVPLTVLDLEAPVGSSDPYATAKTEFEIAKDAVAALAVAQGASDGGYAAVETAYHSTLVPPFCLGAVKSFFDAR
jgi:alpha/beta superfamily hydrolase